MSQQSSQPGSGSQMPIPASTSTSSSRPVPRLPIEQPDEDTIEVVKDLDVERRDKSGKKRRAPEEEVEVEASKSKKKKITKRNVLLWENFIETDENNIVLCNINPSCKARIRRPDGSTSGMRSHFETRHHLQYAEYVEKATASLKEKVIFQYEFYLNTDESE
jgi:hypothetical protein